MIPARKLATLLAVALACTATTAHGGTLYVGVQIPESIVTYNTAASQPTPTTFASSGVGGPLGLAFDAAGNLYVANANLHTIEKFTPGGVGSVFASTGSPPQGPGVRRSGQPVRGLAGQYDREVHAGRGR